MNIPITIGNTFFASPDTAFEYLETKLIELPLNFPFGHEVVWDKDESTGKEVEEADKHITQLDRCMLVELFDYFPDRAEWSDGEDPDFFTAVRDVNSGHVALCAHYQDGQQVFDPLKSIMGYMFKHVPASIYYNRCELLPVNAPNSSRRA
jgi:hypothetical protein